MRNSENNKTGLINLISHLPGGNMAEVGSFSGESAAIFLNSGKFNIIYCVDHWLDLPGMDYVAAESDFDRRFINSQKIVKLKMESGEGASHFDCESLDFVYIDANHGYEHVTRDISLWRPKIKPGMYIGGHDYKKGFDGVVEAVNDAFNCPHHVFEDSSWLVKL